MNKKKTFINIDVRRNDIRELMLEGKTTNTIAGIIKDKYNKSRRTTEKDITVIYKDIKAELELSKESLIELHIARYENLYRFYMDEGEEDNLNIHFNPETAAKMLEKKEKLLGKYTVENVININQQNTLNNNFDFSGYSDKELKGIMGVLNEN